MINRLILWLSLAGMILALHLWIQKARGFDQGCLGLSKPAAVESGGCEEVGVLPSSHLLGVSNAAWGYAFYFALALLSFAKIVAGAGWTRRWHAASEIAVTLGFMYSGYLVYQMGFVAHAWCVLCLGSAGLVAVLFGLHVALRRRGGVQPLEEPARTGEFRLAVGALFAAMGVLVGVLIFVERLGTRPLDQGGTGKEIERIVGESLPVFIDAARLREMRACHFDGAAPTLDLAKFIGPATPFMGKADGVPVIVFYDPNCPHCAIYHPIFLRVMEKFQDRARFIVLPRLLWDASILQAQALKLAEGSDKYFALWQWMFERPKTGGGKGMTVAQIEGLFREMGLDASDLEKRLAAVRPAVLAAREQAERNRIDAVPAVYIGGRKVWSPNRSGDCMGTLIDRMLSDVVKPAAVGEK